MTGVKKYLVAAAAAAALMGAAGAASATTINLTPLSGGTYTAFFGATESGAGGSSFQDVFTFNSPIVGTADSTLTTILLSGVNNIDFDVGAVLLDGAAAFNVVVGGSTAPDTATLTATGIGAGLHTITVNGHIAAASTGGSYGGVLNIGPVPEPATWAMMILGMGMVGFGMRMRRRSAVTAA